LTRAGKKLQKKHGAAVESWISWVKIKFDHVPVVCWSPLMNRPSLSRTLLFCVAVALISVGTVAPSHAVPVVFNVDPVLSSLTISGSFQGAPFSSQTPTSLVDKYFGAVEGNLVGSTLTFSGGSALIALTHPDAAVIAPPGVGETNYGVAIAAIPGQVGAYRDVALDFTGGTATNGVAGGQTLAFILGKLDYAGPATGPGSLNLIGASGSNTSPSPVSFTTAGLVQTLQIPITLTMNDGAGLIQTLQGTIVATREVPEPSTWWLFMVGGAAFCVARQWRTRFSR
jgi:hypothetical protein